LIQGKERLFASHARKQAPWSLAPWSLAPWSLAPSSLAPRHIAPQHCARELRHCPLRGVRAGGRTRACDAGLCRPQRRAPKRPGLCDLAGAGCASGIGHGGKAFRCRAGVL